MPYCSAYGCTNYRAKEELSFFSFPLDKPELKQWVHNCGWAGWKPSRFARLCSMHFEETCFELDFYRELMAKDPSKRRRRRCLKPGVVPTIFQHVHQPKQRQRKLSIERAAKSERENIIAKLLSLEPSKSTAPHTISQKKKTPATTITLPNEPLQLGTIDVNRHVTAMMETEDKEDITAEIHCQVSDTAREEQQSNNKERILPFDSTNQVETWSENVGEPLIKVKLEKVESEDCSSYSGETRHWVVCENGILKEVKLEQSHCVQVMCAGEDCNWDIVHEQNSSSRMTNPND